MKKLIFAICLVMGSQVPFMRMVISVVAEGKRRKNVAPNEGDSIVRMKMFAGRDVGM